MGRKRKNIKVSHKGKKRKIGPDETEKRKINQDVTKEVIATSFVEGHNGCKKSGLLKISLVFYQNLTKLCM